jgi:hypothetical protein
VTAEVIYLVLVFKNDLPEGGRVAFFESVYKIDVITR